MEANDLALSDVYVERDYGRIPLFLEERPNQTGISSILKHYQVFRSRFVFEALETDTTEETQAPLPKVDDDGDLIVVRQPVIKKDVIYIEHTLSTRLVDVGHQVWIGCLLLCDFILDSQREFTGVTALELGGGVGLASITMATVANRVICTDTGDSVLELCSRNCDANKSLYTNGGSRNASILVRQIDWKEPLFTNSSSSTYHWQSADRELLKDVSVIFAADVIYDESRTTAFFSTVHSLMLNPPPKVIYIALERRLNFRLDEMEVACPAYEHFLSCVEELCHPREAAKGDVRFTARQLDTDFPQRFEYRRTKQLVLWRINSTFEPSRKD